MPIIAAGTPVNERLIFNSGFIDFGSNRIVDVDNAAVEISFSEGELRRLNSIKLASHKRKTFKCGLKAKVKAMSKEVFGTIFGTTATDGSGTLITVKDGQPTQLDPVFTAYVDDDVAKPIQFQFTDAVCMSMPVTSSLENYGEYDLDLACRDVQVFYYE
jgi:hypothetical protein